jgi:methionyl-tRNA formyltransferase
MARLAYLGTPELAVAPLRALVDAGHEVVLVVSGPDRRRGRGSATSPSPVKAAARALGLPATSRLRDLLSLAPEARPELGVVVAYGRIIPASVLAALPMVNVHFSLLPRWRGAAPVERAVLSGDRVTGVSLMRLDEGLDTGPVLASSPVPIGEHEHVSTLTQRLADAGATLLVDALAGGVDALGPGTPQRGEPTYAQKISPHELVLDWRRSAIELARVVRLDRAWTTFRGERLLVLEAVPVGAGRNGAARGGGTPGTLHGVDVQTGDGLLELIAVKPAGRRRMTAEEWRRGVRAEAAERLGERHRSR